VKERGASPLPFVLLQEAAAGMPTCAIRR
jgi:hypothetical protein